MGVVAPRAGFNAGLARIAQAHGALLIVDEVMTGFRVARGGWLGLEAARRRRRGRPTSSPSARSWAAGCRPRRSAAAPTSWRTSPRPARSTRRARSPGTRSPPPRPRDAARSAPPSVYAHLDATAATRRHGSSPRRSPPRASRTRSPPRATCSRSSSATSAPRDYDEARTQESWRYAAFFHAMLDHGVYLPPSAFEAWFVSAAHDDAALDRLVDALPAAATAAAARRTRTSPRSSREHPHRRPPAAPRRGPQPRQASSTAGCPASGSPSSASRWPSAPPTRSPTATSPSWSPRRSSARSRPPRPSRPGTACAIAHRRPLIEAGNVFEGQRVGVGDGVLKSPKSWRHLYNPFTPSWGEPYVEIAARMRAAVAAARDAARGHEAVLVSHQLPIWIARLDAEQRRFVHDPRKRQCGLASLTSLTLRRRPPRRHHLHRAVRRPGPPGRARRRQQAKGA